MIYIKTEKEIELMAEAGRCLKYALEKIEEHIRPGVTTAYLNFVAEKAVKEIGAKASFIGEECPYPGGKPYNHVICTSVNDEIIHGIPSSRVLNDGDILSVDITVNKNGFHADAGRTYPVGKISPVAQRLIKVTKDAFFYAMDYAIVENRIGDISNAVQTFVEKNGFSLLREFEGHGIGRQMHEDPGVPNIGRKGTGPRLEAGMALAIEPMVCEGKPDVYVKKDMWTIATIDKKLTAYYENTIIITENEPKILTL